MLSFGHGDDAPNACVQWTSQESVALRPLQCDARHAWTFPPSQRRLQRSSCKYDGIVHNHSVDVAQRVDAFLSQPPVYYVPLVSKTWSSWQQREAPVRLWYANMRGNPPTSCPRIRPVFKSTAEVHATETFFALKCSVEKRWLPTDSISQRSSETRLGQSSLAAYGSAWW